MLLRSTWLGVESGGEVRVRFEKERYLGFPVMTPKIKPKSSEDSRHETFQNSMSR